MSNFLASGLDFLPIFMVSHKCFLKEVRQSTPSCGKIKEEDIFGMREESRGIILGDNLIIKDLIPINLFKEFMTVKSCARHTKCLVK